MPPVKPDLTPQLRIANIAQLINRLVDMLLPLAVTVLAHSRDRRAQMYGLQRVSSADASATPLAKQKKVD